MSPPPEFFTRCERHDHGSQYHHGEYWRFWDDRSMSLLLEKLDDLEGRQGDWDELEREKDEAESESARLDMELAEAQDRIEELERQLEEAKAKVEQENAPSL